MVVQLQRSAPRPRAPKLPTEIWNGATCNRGAGGAAEGFVSLRSCKKNQKAWWQWDLALLVPLLQLIRLQQDTRVLGDLGESGEMQDNIALQYSHHQGIK